MICIEPEDKAKWTLLQRSSFRERLPSFRVSGKTKQRFLSQRGQGISVQWAGVSLSFRVWDSQLDQWHGTSRHLGYNCIRNAFECVYCETHYWTCKIYTRCSPVLLCAHCCYYTQELTKTQHQITLNGHDLLTALTMEINTTETATNVHTDDTCTGVGAHTHTHTRTYIHTYIYGIYIYYTHTHTYPATHTLTHQHTH